LLSKRLQGILLFGEYHYMFIIRYFMNNKKYIVFMSVIWSKTMKVSEGRRLWSRLASLMKDLNSVMKRTHI